MSTAEQFVANRNRELRMTTAEKDSTEHQITVQEKWIVDQAKKIEAETQTMRKDGLLTEEGIAQKRNKMIDEFEQDAEKRIKRVADRVAGFEAKFVPPEQPAHVTQMLTNHFMANRSTLLRDAITGKNKELGLALLHAPQTMTELSPDARRQIERHFMSEKDIRNIERKKDIQYRGQSVLDAYTNERRRLRT